MRQFYPGLLLFFMTLIGLSPCYANHSVSYPARYIPEIESLFSKQTLDRAKTTHVLVAITTHFDPSRIQYLASVLTCLSTFPKADIVLVTNTFNERELAALQQVCGEKIPNGVGGGAVTIRSYGNLAHPFDLTWCHKEIIANEFINNDKGYSHFIYLEDDIPFVNEKFA